MNKMVTMAQIAKKAGVSSGVVSRIINKDETLRIGQHTRKRVEDVIHELNFSPNVVAQSLASSRSGTIAMIVHDIANPVYAEIVRGAQKEASLQNKAIILGDASAGRSSNVRIAQMISGGGVDGLILQPAGESSDEVIARAVKKEVPIALLQAQMEVDAHLIQLPDKEAAKIATEHLKDLGHKNIGCLATEEGLTFTDLRLSGWREAMEFYARNELVAYAPPNSDGGEFAVSELLKRNVDITGLVCFNVVAAVGVLRFARKIGLKIPQELSVIAIHDVKFAQDLSVPMTVVSTPLFEMGQAAVKAVCFPKSEVRSSFQLVTEPKLLIRKSTSRPAIRI